MAGFLDASVVNVAIPAIGRRTWGGSLIALVPAERRIRTPMLKLSLFASRQFTAINVATVLFYGALAGAGYLLVLRCELTLGYRPRRPVPS